MAWFTKLPLPDHVTADVLVLLLCALLQLVVIYTMYPQVAYQPCSVTVAPARHAANGNMGLAGQIMLSFQNFQQKLCSPSHCNIVYSLSML
jgi:hypothetical protein